MAKDIYQISENIIGAQGYIYVRATEREIEEREYRGGFARFNSGAYADGKDYPRGSKVENQPILSIGKFDKWLKEHNCV
jgi:hypothetical protein